MGFRKRLETINNMYVIDYLANRLGKRGRSLVTLFVDLKAAFDLVNRRVLVEIIRQRGIRAGLVERETEAIRGNKE